MHPIETPDKTFHDGDGVSELGTILPAWWLNQVQSELLAVLTAAGIQPDKANSGQLLEAIKKVAPKIPIPEPISRMLISSWSSNSSTTSIKRRAMASGVNW